MLIDEFDADDANARPLICPWCGEAVGVVLVHGHAQCVVCGMNVESCCEGAPM